MPIILVIYFPISTPIILVKNTSLSMTIILPVETPIPAQNTGYTDPVSMPFILAT
jgi:hypothetical protein